MTRRFRGLPVAALAFALLVVLLLVPGCGGEDTPTTESGTGHPQAGGGGVLRYAMPALPNELDPLAAESSEAQTVTRQVHEPLVAELNGPYGDLSRQPGLAVSIRPSKDRTIWSLHLRPGVRFQDGTPFNASAVLANARRWRSLPAGRSLLPSLFAVDAPRPDLVRFLLNRATPELPRQLTSPRLGIVSPSSLQPRSGAGARIVGGPAPGTGPFEWDQNQGSAIVLARDPDWWGTPLNLGPALDVVDFRAVQDPAQRLGQLQGGEVEVASGLTADALTQVGADPVLTTVDGGIGLERSVRGLTSAKPIPFSGVWLTTVAGG